MRATAYRMRYPLLSLLIVVALALMGASAIRYDWIVTKKLTVLDGGFDAISATMSEAEVGTLTATDLVVDGFAQLTAQEMISVTMNGAIVPTGSLQPLGSAGTVHTANVSCGDAGNLVTLINTTATSIVLSDTGTLKLTGAITLGQLDTLMLMSDGTNCVQIATANN